jgi:3-oxoacyl-[acyl-carrier-protein] synthase II
MKHPEAIWITGVGAGTPLGWDFATISANLIAGKSAVKKVDSFAVSQHPSQIAAVLDPIPCPAGWDAAEFAGRTRLEQLCLWCCVEALRDADLWSTRAEKRIGLIVGNATEWGWNWEDDAFTRGRWPGCDPANDRPPLVATLKRDLGLTGPALTMSAACASGNFALEQARCWLELGWVDACIAGACDTAVTPMTLAGFGNLRAISRQNDRPQAASRPFDKARDGFVLGEGGAVYVVERASAARRRGARVYGEMAGCGLSSDAYHTIIPAPEPVQAISAIRGALTDAKIDASDVDYVNAHGTSTPVGDIVESKALRNVFGERVQNVPVSSTKSMIGHLLTAASSVEALACLATFEYSAIPPTINLDDPDPECDLCHVAHQAREQAVRVAISNSFGFGGSNSCAVFRAV